MATILIVDDDPIVLAMVGEFLAAAGHAALAAEDGEQALRLLPAVRCDLVILDLLMPHKDGLECIGEIRARYPSLPILAISGGGSARWIDILAVAVALGADDSLAKPIRREILLAKIAGLLAIGGSRDRFSVLPEARTAHLTPS